MVEQVGGLAGKLPVVGGHGGERGFHAFLADLLRHAAHALLREADGVAALVAALDPAGDHLVEVSQKADTGGACVAETAGRPAMAGRAVGPGGD